MSGFPDTRRRFIDPRVSLGGAATSPYRDLVGQSCRSAQTSSGEWQDQLRTMSGFPDTRRRFIDPRVSLGGAATPPYRDLVRAELPLCPNFVRRMARPTTDD